MKGLAVCRYEDAAASPYHPIEGHHVSGATTARNLGPAEYSLWLVELEVDAGGELHLPPLHGDEAIYIRSGRVEVAGVPCEAGGTIVVESQASPVIRATAPTVVLHMGPTDPSAVDRSTTGADRSTVHVVGSRGRLAVSGAGRASHYYADSTCAGCDLTLLFTSRDEAYESPTHSHSVDELIHVVRGSLRLGSYAVAPGDTLAVSADRRYGFRAEGGFAFLNYRSAASSQTVVRGELPLVEGGLVNGFGPVPDGFVDVRLEV